MSSERHRRSFDRAVDSLEPRRTCAVDTEAPFIEGVAFDYDAPRPTITIDFNEHVDAQFLPGPVLLRRGEEHSNVNPLNLVLLGYDAETDVATLGFRNMLDATAPYDGDYRLTVPRGAVQDDAGNNLNPEVRLDFFSLAGDANHDHAVGLPDFAALTANFNQPNRTFSQGDFNYDGRADLADFAVLTNRYGDGAAQAAAAAPGARVPSTSAASGGFGERLIDLVG